jgi:hypothetical protein
MTTQSQMCLDFCGPLTPNGCDCFGCCLIPGATTPIFLGSVDASGNGSCNVSSLSDNTKCKPCTQVTACLNTCLDCEICIGKPELPASCTEQLCPTGAEPCGLAGQAACPSNKFCVTGCCQPLPQ